MMKEQLDHPDMLEFLLPSFIALAQHASADDYKKLIQSDFNKIFSMQRPTQVFSIALLFVVEYLNIILFIITLNERKDAVNWDTANTVDCHEFTALLQIINYRLI